MQDTIELESIEKKGRINYHYEQHYNPPRPYGAIDLLQIGTSYFQPSTSVALHTHVGFFELTVVTSGKGKIIANNVSVPVEKGDIFVSFPFDTHSIEADGREGMNYNFCAFYLKDAELLLDMDKLSKLHGKPTERVVRSDTLASIITSAISETSKERIHQAQYLEALFLQMIIQLIRTFNKQISVESTPSKREQLCYQVMDYINTHIYSMTSLSEIAEHFSYDYTYISKIFTQTTSQSISEYYRFQRLEVARALIHEDSLKLSEIAERLRYSSIYSFSKAFKQQYELSPRAYRKLHFERES